MKRSRRVVLTMMGSAVIGAVTTGFVPRTGCGPGLSVEPGPDGRPYCRPLSRGFGGTSYRLHGHVDGGSHDHGHGGGHAHGGG